MDLKQKFGLTDIVNAAGTFTPIGVSRSSAAVAEAAGEALKSHFIIEELQQTASRQLAGWSGAEAGAITHCTAASITLAVAAAMTGTDPALVAALPGTTGLQTRVVLPAGHQVNYGQPIIQAIRLAGATPVAAGSDDQCSIADLEQALAHEDTACLLLVSSRLTWGEPIDLSAAIRAAQRANVPVIIDAAAQDMRPAQLLASGADLVLFSAQKYLAAPTAGLVVGSSGFVQAVRAQEKGIGRAMKASKESILGVLAALEERQGVDLAAWSEVQAPKTDWLLGKLNGLPGLSASLVSDPTGMPFARLGLQINPAKAGMDAAALAARLKAGSPSIWVIERNATAGELTLELVQLEMDEVKLIRDVIASLLQN